MAIELWWLPLGGGDTTGCVRVNGHIFEALVAARGRRPRRDLYHSALVVHLGGVRSVIEMTPVWGNPPVDRGVVGEGPVGLPWLGRSRFFRYEVRRWPGGGSRTRRRRCRAPTCSAVTPDARAGCSTWCPSARG